MIVRHVYLCISNTISEYNLIIAEKNALTKNFPSLYLKMLKWDVERTEKIMSFSLCLEVLQLPLKKLFLGRWNFRS
jgi:hypothetical protein